MITGSSTISSADIFLGTGYEDLQLDTGIDLSGANNPQVHYKKPSGETGVWPATIEGSTLFYNIASGDLNESGTWSLQAAAAIAGEPAKGKIVDMEVLVPLIIGDLPATGTPGTEFTLMQDGAIPLITDRLLSVVLLFPEEEASALQAVVGSVEIRPAIPAYPDNRGNAFNPLIFTTEGDQMTITGITSTTKVKLFYA
ncbi:hypothetical protein [Flavihumibacter petaseus]|uniref:Uncharacterized protein n=1 Tax=Flavihumibacter petaseus NBRC 106054 TaxID=1220578 RepID=A0A0E9N1Z6_9BACT|nr:hypothetical protein [Flavihumibacter petaseus]GAO43813.1 hypothetical protein FPE01S_02_09190 [Flavihumibacter petaseus NBRC 106054]